MKPGWITSDRSQPDGGNVRPGAAATIQITMDDLVISPAEASAKVGDTIEWINKDILVHTATARNGDWDIDDAGEEDRHLGSEEGGHDRILLPLPSQHEGEADGRALSRRGHRAAANRNP